MKKIKVLSLIYYSIIMLFINSCSYQKMNSIDQKKFLLQEFEMFGDTRETFIIQKKIQRFSNKESKNKIKIFISLKKKKQLKKKIYKIK